jgi:hypothetical protein
MNTRAGKLTHHDPPKPFAKRMAPQVNYDLLPLFVSTRKLTLFCRRVPRTIRKWLASGYLPERMLLNNTYKGWWKEDIVKWLKKHPEAVRQ